DGYGWIVHRREPDERRHILRLGVGSAPRFYFLGSSGLAGGSVAVEDRSSGSAEQDYAFHHLLHLCRRHRRDHAMLLGRMEDYRLWSTVGGKLPGHDTRRSV